MPALLIGPGMVLVFGVSGAFRDVFFARTFQSVDFFTVILLTFAISAALFGGITVLGAPAELAKLRRQGWTLLAINVATAAAWTSYFFALKHLQPSIVNTLHSGVGPLTVIILAGSGINIAKRSAVRPAEYICFAGLAVSLVYLWWVVLSGRSGLGGASALSALAGLGLLIVSGASITISHLLSKRLNERGLGAMAITASRYILIILIAALVTITGDGPSGIGTPGDLIALALAASVLIVLPTFSLQVGIAHTQPLTATVIRSLGPVLVFALELADGRIDYSGPALAGIILYSVFVIAGNVVRGWRDEAREN